jgi:hypothetical protein
MTITSTEERSFGLEEAEPTPPDDAVVAPPPSVDSPPPTADATDPGEGWGDVEEAEPSRAPSTWMTRFAWAKTLGGW